MRAMCAFVAPADHERTDSQRDGLTLQANRYIMRISPMTHRCIKTMNYGNILPV